MPLETEDDTYITKIPFFIEPSTGERKEISDENYIGIEAVWNHINYWVNLQSLVGGCTVCITDYYMFIYFANLNVFCILIIFIFVFVFIL